jgi:hypothetical protein
MPSSGKNLTYVLGKSQSKEKILTSKNQLFVTESVKKLHSSKLEEFAALFVVVLKNRLTRAYLFIEIQVQARDI